MQIEIFHVPVTGQKADLEPVNRFLSSHKIVTIDRRFVDAGENSFWSLFVTYLNEGAAGSQPSDKRIDYKEVLSPSDFELFADLRSLRKDLAEKNGVPVYSVFTNEQLASIVTERATSVAAVAKIKGVGKAKLDKYGAVISQRLLDLAASSQESDNGQADRKGP